MLAARQKMTTARDGCDIKSANTRRLVILMSKSLFQHKALLNQANLLSQLLKSWLFMTLKVLTVGLNLTSKI